MSIAYSDLTEKIQDEIRNSNFVSTREAEIKRAINKALDKINIGDIGEDPRKRKFEIGYDYQLATASVSFVDGTDSYSFSTLGLVDYKFPAFLRSSDEEFTQVEEEAWFRKHDIEATGEEVYKVIWLNGTRYLYVNHETTETLTFGYYDNAQVLNGSTRQTRFSDNSADNETLLMPDSYYSVVVDFTLSDLFGQKDGIASNEYLKFLQSGQETLKRMIESLGRIKELPRKHFRVRGEWILNSPRRSDTNN